MIYPSFQEACKALHLIHDDTIWERTIHDASNAGLPNQLREMFAYMLLNCNMSDPPSLWEQFRDILSEDYNRNGFSQNISHQKALSDISFVLRGSSKNHCWTKVSRTKVLVGQKFGHFFKIWSLLSN